MWKLCSSHLTLSFRWSYKVLNTHVNAIAKGLVMSQFSPNSKIVVWTKDVAEGIVSQLGAMKAGVNVRDA